VRALVLASWLAGFMALPSAWSAECIFSPKPERPGLETSLLDGRQSVSLPEPRMFEDCLRVIVAKGTALAQYIDRLGKPKSDTISEGKGVDPADMAPNPVPVRAVGRSLVAMLTEGKEGKAVGQKFFDKPSEVGAPFGDLYIPPEGLSVRFYNLEPDARIRIADFSTQRVLLESAASMPMTLDRGRFKAGGKYSVQVLASRGKLPPGAFEVVDQALTDELDRSLQALAKDPQLDRNTSAIARALMFEREGLSFNRETAIRGMRQ
jgi:hypothetical protein